ncbi:MAG: hypothetical protein J0M10_04865 [Chitinophagales bacterium]|nr:hypothetical protein [Chitinophagales bacterium]
MKKTHLFVFGFLLLTVLAGAQTPASPKSTEAAKPATTLKEVMTLPMPGDEGANGASVAWHPVQKKYYAAIAGNVKFAMAVFDIKGKRLSSDTLKTGFDVRGLWYNPKKKNLQTNGYNDFGWGEYSLNSKGIPVFVKTIAEGMNQPAEQSVGAFNPVKNEIYFFNDEGNISVYNAADGIVKEDILLYLATLKEEADDFIDNLEILYDYNLSTVVYTGIKGAELGLLSSATGEIELYDISTGYMTRALALPDTAPLEDNLNFSYANGIYWLFDKKTRSWKGYK